MYEVAPARPGERVLTGHTGAVTDLAFLSDTTVISASPRDTSLRVWNLNDGTSKPFTGGGMDRFNAFSVSADRSIIATQSISGPGERPSVQTWKLADGTPELLHRIAGIEPNLAPDGAHIAVTQDGRIAIQRLADGTNTPAILGRTYSEWGQRYAWRSDGKAILVGDESRIVEFLIATGQRGRNWLAGKLVPIAVSASLDGRYVATTWIHGLAIVPLDRTDSRILIDGAQGPRYAVELSPDGSAVAAAWGDLTVRVYRTADGVHLRTLSWYGGDATSLAFSPDDGTIRHTVDASRWQQADPDRDAPDPELAAAQRRQKASALDRAVDARATVCARARSEAVSHTRAASRQLTTRLSTLPAR